MNEDTLTATEENNLWVITQETEKATEAMLRAFHDGSFLGGTTRAEAAEFADELVSAAETLADELQTLIAALELFEIGDNT